MPSATTVLTLLCQLFRRVLPTLRAAKIFLCHQGVFLVPPGSFQGRFPLLVTLSQIRGDVRLCTLAYFVRKSWSPQSTQMT